MFKYCLIKMKAYFFANFRSNDFLYILYPFLRIFKLFLFAPVKLNESVTLKENYKFQLDKWSCLATFIGILIFVGGFWRGVYCMSMTKGLAELHDTTVIAYFSTWGQIAFLFALASYGILNSWLNLSKMQQLFIRINNIDKELEQVLQSELNYGRMRSKLLIQFGVVFLVPTTLSMVNCIIIHMDPDLIDFFSSCFWFVCFAPILLLTFKEFQFYNLMFILKSKFDLINEQLQQYDKRNLSKNHADTTLCQLSECSVTDLQSLLDIYSETADCVNLTLHVFSWHLLFLTTASFAVITIQGYNLFAALIAHTFTMEYHQLIVIIAWILVQIAIIGINVNACTRTSHAITSTGFLLHRIKQKKYSEHFYHILNLFSLEVLQRKKSFTAAGFFNMDYSLITSIVAAVITYLLIIIQFHLTGIPKKSIN